MFLTNQQCSLHDWLLVADCFVCLKHVYSICFFWVSSLVYFFVVINLINVSSGFDGVSGPV